MSETTEILKTLPNIVLFGERISFHAKEGQSKPIFQYDYKNLKNKYLPVIFSKEPLLDEAFVDSMFFKFFIAPYKKIPQKTIKAIPFPVLSEGQKNAIETLQRYIRIIKENIDWSDYDLPKPTYKDASLFVMKAFLSQYIDLMFFHAFFPNFELDYGGDREPFKAFINFGFPREPSFEKIKEIFPLFYHVGHPIRVMVFFADSSYRGVFKDRCK